VINDPDQFVDQQNIKGNAECIFLGLLGQFAGQASMAWNMMISIRIFMTLWSPKVKSHKPIFYHLYVWGICTINAGVIAITGHYGPTIDGCWINNDHYVIGFFVTPISIYFVSSIAILIYCVWKIKMLMRDLSYHSLLDKESRFQRQIIAYIIIFILFWIGPLTLKVTGYIPGLQMLQTPLAYVDCICLPLQGLANATVWATSRTFIQTVKKAITRKKSKPLEHVNISHSPNPTAVIYKDSSDSETDRLIPPRAK